VTAGRRVNQVALFESSLELAAPADDMPPAVAALWWLRKGDWNRAHGIVQDHEGDAACDWVHAVLHRMEGDSFNARYWYRRAGRAVPDGDVAAEADAVLAALLRAGEAA
jgi:hypothetical protein